MRIFGKNFVKNNKNKCKMIIEGHEEKIKEFINVDETLKNKYQIYIECSKKFFSKWKENIAK